VQKFKKKLQHQRIKEERLLQDSTDKPTGTGRCYGMEMNVEKQN
jgi:hypothetical protein